MKIIKRAISVSLLSVLISMSLMAVPFTDFGGLTVEAHSGRTDSNGGHKDNKNASGLGSYHYHCGGYPAHLHTNGVCPYTSGSATSSGTVGQPPAAADEEVKLVQQALHDLGYECGEADGIFGEKTKDALIQFQQDKGLTADGIIGPKVREALGLPES